MHIRVSDIELSLMILSQTEYIIALHAHVKYPGRYLLHKVWIPFFHKESSSYVYTVYSGFDLLPSRIAIKKRKMAHI